LQELAHSAEFVAELDRVHALLEPKAPPTEPEIAYFCMEFGMAAFVKI
jgi:hypothetical protein